jgi:hypothetical protein
VARRPKMLARILLSRADLPAMKTSPRWRLRGGVPSQIRILRRRRRGVAFIVGH